LEKTEDVAPRPDFTPGAVLYHDEAPRAEGRQGHSATSFLPVRLEWRERNGYSSQMKRATLTETRNNLSALVDQVQHGETILILDRGRPVARLESVVGAGDDPEGRLARLERQGLLRRASAPLPREILMAKPAAAAGGASIQEALLADRRDAR
jgi:prevent-host-death family protein